MQEGGGTLREHLQALARAGRARADIADPGPFPERVGYLWQWWHEVAQGRTWSVEAMGMGMMRRVPNPITWRDLQAWSESTGQEIAPHEASALMEIDRAWRWPGEFEEDLKDGAEAEDETIWPEGWRD